MSTVQEQIDFILGPQLPIGTSYFDQVQVSRGKILGQSCPPIPPTDASALNSYVLNLQYYDLPLSLYIANNRTGDPAFVTMSMNAAISWWQHPQWIKSGAQRDFDNGQGPPPRHAGVGGLILAALNGHPEMWEWIVAYTLHQFDNWLKKRINDPALYYGVREGAFMLQYAAWLSFCLPDSYPLQAGGTATNGAQVRAQLLADVEAVVVSYHGRLQKSDGSWRWDDVDVRDPDGGTLVGIMQPFMVGLLLCALCDVHRLTTNTTVQANIQNQILKACRHLYSDGPYRKDDPVPYDPTKRWRTFWYLYHGGTTVDPTKFESGGWGYPGTSITDVQDGRQAIGPVIATYAYAYKLSGDTFYRDAGNELWDSAYGPTDGIHNFFDTDGKGYNQNARRAGSYLVWAGGTVSAPTPTTQPAPLPTAPTITSPANGATVAGTIDVVGSFAGLFDIAYLVIDDTVNGSATGSPFDFKVDTAALADGPHSLFIRVWGGASALDSARISVTVANKAVTPTPPAPIPTPIPIPSPTSAPSPRPLYEYIKQTFSTETTFETAIKSAAAQGYGAFIIGPSGKTLYGLRIKQ